MSKLLDNKVALVTGAGQGIGRAVAQAFAVDGAKVLLVGRVEEKLLRTAELVRGLGGIGDLHAVDLTSVGEPRAAIEKALDAFGGIDIVVNAAGVFLWKKVFDVDEEDWQKTIATNLSAPFLLSQAAAEAMVEQERGGSLINMASIHGLVGDPNLVPHCASKAGLIGMTKAMAEALRPYGIRVNAIAPGSVEPDSSGRRAASPQEKVTQADLANLTTYLASDLSCSITGAVVEAYGSTRMVIKA